MPEIDVCEHNEEFQEELAKWATWESSPEFCGTDDLHSPHDGCPGLMCHYGCNAENF